MTAQEQYKKETGYDPKILICTDGVNNKVYSKQYTEWLQFKVDTTLKSEVVAGEPAGVEAERADVVSLEECGDGAGEEA